MQTYGSVPRHAINPAIKTAFDAGVVELPDRRGAQEGGHHTGINRAVVIEGAVQGYQHVLVTSVVTDAPDEAASRDVCAIKELQIDFTAVFDVDALCARQRRADG